MTDLQKKVSFYLFVLFSLSLLDGGLTLLIIEKGATELNPVMNWFLSYGQTIFMLAKFALTFCFIFAMLYFVDSYTKIVVSSIWVSLVLYLGIIGYHCFLRSLL